MRHKQLLSDIDSERKHNASKKRMKKTHEKKYERGMSRENLRILRNRDVIFTAKGHILSVDSCEFSLFMCDCVCVT